MAPLRSCPWANFLPHTQIDIAVRNARSNSAHRASNFCRIVPTHDAMIPIQSTADDSRRSKSPPSFPICRCLEVSAPAGNIESQHRAEEIDFKTLDPSDGEAEITSERSKNAGTGRRQPERLPLISIVFSDRGRWQHSHEFGDRIEHGLNEDVGIRSRPRAVVAIGPEAIVFDDMTNPGNQTAGLLAVDRDDGFGDGAEPARIGGEGRHSRISSGFWLRQFGVVTLSDKV